jgi:hypothetical protein
MKHYIIRPSFTYILYDIYISYDDVPQTSQACFFAKNFLLYNFSHSRLALKTKKNFCTVHISSNSFHFEDTILI